jgi:glucokinase
MILAGDVGGTKTNLGLFDYTKGKIRPLTEQSFASQEYSSFEAIVEKFLSGQKRRKISGAAVGVAGPVVRGRTQIVNLRWPVDSGKLSRALGLKQVRLLNDLEATAWGIPELSPRKLAGLTPGLRGRPGNGALIAAGTGLGMAILVQEGDGFRPAASEGGHQGFTPRDELEIELLRYMQKKYHRVSLERVIAGPGFSEMYDFLISSGRRKETLLMKRRLAGAEDRNAVISLAGTNNEDRTASMVVDLFVSLYGAAAGDLALVARATAGLYVGGGIAPKILPKLRDGRFIRAFRDKGRLSPLVEKIPVRVILEPRTALLGAAACAARA